MSLAADRTQPRSRGRLNRSLAAGLLALTLSACSSFGPPTGDPPDVSLAGLSFGEPGLFEQGFTLQLRVKNPNDFEIPFEGLNFALEVNDAPFATGLSNKNFTLPASAELIVPIDVSIATTDLIERVAAVGAGKRLDYRLSGAAEIDSWFPSAIPFERIGKLALPNLPVLTEDEATDG